MRDSIAEGKGFGYKDEDKICMIRCFKCGRENWAPAVASGNCAWCGHNPNGDKDGKSKEIDNGGTGSGIGEAS